MEEDILALLLLLAWTTSSIDFNYIILIKTKAMYNDKNLSL